MRVSSFRCPYCPQTFETRKFWTRHVKYCEQGPHAREHTPQIQARDESLDCFWCGKLFKDFKVLALHVQNHGVENFAEAIRYYQEKETENMLPSPGGPGGQRPARDGQGSGGRPKPAVPFIKAEDLGRDPQRAKILMVQTENTGFNDVIVKIAVKGKSFFFGLKASNGNFKTLFNAFGSDENSWIGQEFMIGLEWNDWYEKNFVNVMEAPASASKAKTK
jgi:uncharacterized C2H2 Zn-finger protein